MTTDIKIFFDPNQSEFGDVRLEYGDFVKETGWETSVLMAEFTDKRVDADESPDGEPHGWWARDLDSDGLLNFGNKAWTLYKSKLIQATLKQLEQYYKAALQDDIDAGIYRDVIVAATKLSTHRARIQIAGIKPDDKIIKEEFILPWNSQLGRG